MADETIFRLFQSGRFYDFTVYTDPRTGRPVFRQRYNSRGKGIKYLDQQVNRSHWLPLINSYRELMPFVGETFPQKEEKQSDYNAYVAANFHNITTFPTREQARKGACILEPLTISQGPLAPIGYKLSADRTKVVTNIRLNGLTEITAQTTIGEFSRALTPKDIPMVCGKPVNPNDVRDSLGLFLPGDELYFWRLRQEYVDVPTIGATRSGVMLDNNSDRTLWSQTGEDGFTVEHTTVDGEEGYYLSCRVVDETSVAWMRSRRGNPLLKGKRDRVLVSTQTTLGESSLAAVYRSHEALLKSIESYGGVNRVNYSAPSANNGAYDLSQGVAGSGSGSGSTGSGSGSGSTGSGSGSGSTGSGSGNTDPTYTITARVLPSSAYGTVAITPSQMPVPRGTQLTLTATPASGKRVKQWNTGATTASITVTANADAEYTVTFEDEGGLSVKDSEE